MTVKLLIISNFVVVSRFGIKRVVCTVIILSIGTHVLAGSNPKLIITEKDERDYIYIRTSIARTPMARLPWLIQTCF